MDSARICLEIAMGNASRAQLFSRAALTKVPVSTIIYECGQYELDKEDNWIASGLSKQDKNRLKK